MYRMERMMEETRDMTLRKARASDKPFLLHLRKTTMTEHLEAAGIFLSSAQHEARIEEEFECALIAEYSGRPVGIAKCRETDDCIEIMQLQVLPEYQGRGIGKNIMSTFIEAAARQRKRLALSVLKANPAKRLYERLGFRVVGEDEYEFHMQLFG